MYNLAQREGEVLEIIFSIFGWRTAELHKESGMVTMFMPHWRSAGIQGLVKSPAYRTTAPKEGSHGGIRTSHQPREFQ